MKATPQAGEAGTAHLVVASLDGTQSACRRAASAHAPDETRFLGVTTDGDPDPMVDAWHRHAGGPPRATGIVSVCAMTRSTSAADPSGGPIPLGRNISMRVVTEVADLRTIGTSVGEYLVDWADDRGTTVLCFDSLTPLFEVASLETMFRFLHLLIQQVAAVGAVAYLRVDPEVVDEAALDTLAPLFDTVYESDDG